MPLAHIHPDALSDREEVSSQMQAQVPLADDRADRHPDVTAATWSTTARSPW